MEEKLQWSQGGDLGEEGGEGGSMKESLPLTLCTYVRIPMPISIPCMGKEGSGERRGKLTKCWVRVCHYHYEQHYDVRL